MVNRWEKTHSRHAAIVTITVALLVFLTGAIIFSIFIRMEEAAVFSLEEPNQDSSMRLEHVQISSNRLLFDGFNGISLIGIPLNTAQVRDLRIQLDVSNSGDKLFQLTADVYGLDGRYDDHRAQREFTIDQGTTHLDFEISLDSNRPEEAYFRLFGEIPSDVSITMFKLSATEEAVLYPDLQAFFSIGAMIVLGALIAVGSISLYQHNKESYSLAITENQSANTPRIMKKRLETIEIISWSSLLTSILYIVFHVKFNTILFADGSYSAITALSTLRWNNLIQGFAYGYFSRFVVHTLFNIFPLVLKQFGVLSVDAIVSSLAFGHIVWTFIIYGITMYYLRKSKKLMLMSLTAILGCFTLFFTGFFMSIESGLLASVYWLILVYILHMEEMHKKPILGTLIIFFALSLGGIHEFSSVLSLMLIAVLLIQFLRRKTRFSIYWGLLILSLLFSSLLGWKGIIQPRDIGTRGQLIKSIFGIDRSILLICCLMFFMFLLALFTMKNGKEQRNFVTITFVIQGLLSVILVAMAIFRYLKVAYGSYDARILNFIFPFALTIWVCSVEFLNIHIPDYLFVPQALSFLLAVMIFSTLSTVTYSIYLDGISDFLAERPGIHEVSEYSGPFEDYNWGWSAACESVLSQIIYDEKTILPGAISANDGSWEPFDSEDIAQYPDLTSYGIIYDFR